MADIIDYQLFGEEMQYVEIELDPGEAAIGEAGGMMFMQDGIALDTVFGNGNQQGGIFGKLLGAGKRLLTGESLFMTVYSNQSNAKRKVGFAAPYPGKIVPIELPKFGGTFICQKTPSCVPLAASRSASRSRSGWASASSAAKGSSCRNSKATAWRLSTPAARSCGATLRPASCCE